MAATPAASSPRSGLAGQFITFEGIDGCGKTVQVNLLAKRLAAQGVPLLQTREPGGTTIGQGLRRVLLDPAHTVMTPQCEVLLYLADRMQHLAEVMRPALVRGELVLCDRFHDATLAYQKYGRGLDFKPLEALIAREIQPMPHLTFWLDLDVPTARQRVLARLKANQTQAGAESRIDEDAPDFHERVREGYQDLARLYPQRIVRIDA
ncbi:MAG TPA: dTMP kinase, partial [bacterium]